MESVVISDTSCLVVFEKIGQLELLKMSFERVFITPTVALEFGNLLPPWIKIQAPRNQNLQFLLEETIDPGESSSIALAMEIPGCFLILDDLRARKMAKSMNLSFTGTLGLIASAKRRGLIVAARPLFEKIQQTDFRISPRLVEEIMAELGE